MEFISPHSLPVTATAAAQDAPGLSPASGERPQMSRPDHGAQPIAFYFRSWPFPYDPKMAAQAEKGFSAWQDRLMQYRAASLEHQRDHAPQEPARKTGAEAEAADRTPTHIAADDHGIRHRKSRIAEGAQPREPATLAAGHPPVDATVLSR